MTGNHAADKIALPLERMPLMRAACEHFAAPASGPKEAGPC
jgi:hypothetical protein